MLNVSPLLFFYMILLLIVLTEAFIELKSDPAERCVFLYVTHCLCEIKPTRC